MESMFTPDADPRTRCEPKGERSGPGLHAGNFPSSFQNHPQWQCATGGPKHLCILHSPITDTSGEILRPAHVDLEASFLFLHGGTVIIF